MSSTKPKSTPAEKRAAALRIKPLAKTANMAGVAFAVQLEAERAVGFNDGEAQGRHEVREECLSQIAITLARIGEQRTGFFFKQGVDMCVEEIESLKRRMK